MRKATDGTGFSPYGILHGVFVPIALLEAGISHGAAICYARLASYDNRRLGFVWPTQTALAVGLSCTERQVRRYLTELKLAGLIHVERRGTKKGRVGRPGRIVFHNPAWITRALRTDRTRMSGQSTSDRSKMSGQSRTPIDDRARPSCEVRTKPLNGVTAPRGRAPSGRGPIFADRGNPKNQQRVGSMVAGVAAALSRK